MNSNQRIFYYDFLRAFAIFAVILCHVDGLIGYSFYNLKLAMPGLLTCIALTGVPIFFMLSGALLLNRTYSLKEFYKKRFSRIMPPFIFWTLLSIFIGVLALNWTNKNAIDYFFGITSPTWYVWVLIGVYLIIPIINSFLKEYKLKGLEFFLAIWVITILFNTYQPYFLKTLELSYFAGYIGYVILGYYLDNKEFKLSDKNMFFIGILIFILFTIVHMIIFYRMIPLSTDHYLNIITVCQSIGLFLMIKYLDKISLKNNNLFSRIKTNWVGKIILSLSLCSYGMFLNHYIILEYIKQFNFHSLKALLAILIITLLLSWFVSYLASKIPFIGKLSGVK